MEVPRIEPKYDAIFLDRDGVINRELGDYVTRAEDFELLPGVVEAIRLLRQVSHCIIIFTNQAGVGRGRMSLADLESIHAKLQSLLHLDGIYACVHAPEEGCRCRKPLPGLLVQAATDHSLELSKCLVVGDTPRDLAAGEAVGAKLCLVLSGKTKEYDSVSFDGPKPNLVFDDLLHVAKSLL